ncbi:MAG TPA: cupredoxin domain-containing protein [Solirubrobacteraceae bacterium]|nr:cupredoxin domain-containing protein [Solirubrobacteraceae bacterium]
MRHVLPAALCAAILLAGCGDDDKTAGPTTTASPAAATSTIRIVDFIYLPDPVTVKVGQRIAVVNADRASHTITEVGSKPSFDSGTVVGRKRGSVTFSRTGTFKYFCQFHPTMKGTVTVTS